MGAYAGLALAIVAAVWCVGAWRAAGDYGLTWHQAFVFAPLALLFRIRLPDGGVLDDPAGPAIMLVSRQSRLDALIMTLVLPQATEHLHISGDQNRWFMVLAAGIGRTSGNIGLTSEARLTASLLRDGMACVYVDHHIEPDEAAFDQLGMIGEIARQTGARIIPVHIRGSRFLSGSAWSVAEAPRHLLPELQVGVSEAIEPAPAERTLLADRLVDGLALAKFSTVDRSVSLFAAMVASARLHGPGRESIEDAVGGKLTTRRMLVGARIFAGRIADMTEPGEAVGVLLPNANGVVVTLFSLFSSGRVAAMLNYTAGPAAILSALATGKIRLVLCSRGFVEKAELGGLIAAIEDAGVGVVYVEDIRDQVTPLEKVSALVNWSRPVRRQKGTDPAVILFTSGSEGTPKGVVLSHANLIANAGQADCRIDFSDADTLFNVLPVFHSFGLTGGTLLPLLYGLKLFLYPSPLHYKIIPAIARKVQPTIMFGTDTFLAGYGRAAKDGDFDSLRLIVAGAEAVKPETRRIFRERFGAEIVEGYGMTEAAPVTAVNSSTHAKAGSVGRPLPGMSVRLEKVEGIEEGGRMWVAGPNVMMGYMLADRPGELQPLIGGWHDSGDIVVLDERGFISIRGRAKRFAKIAGEMVSLGAVEMLVESLWPEAHHAAVTLPDRRKGERIVLVTTKMPALKDELQAHSRRFGATELMVPNDIINVQAIPVLASGKTDYITAQKLANEKLANPQ